MNVDTVQDIERAFGMPSKEAAQVAASPASAPASPSPPQPSFQFISERPAKTIPLLYPFAIDDKEYREYTLRRLSAEQVAEVGQGLRRTGQMAELYSAISGLPFLACKKMDADDAEVLANEALGFMPASLKGILPK